MESPRLTRSKSSMKISYDQLKVKTVQDKITQQYDSAPRRKREISLRIAVLKKNYRKRLVEEINEKKRQILLSATMAVEGMLENEPKPEVEPKKEVCKLKRGQSLIRTSRLVPSDSKKTSDDSNMLSSSSLRRTKSFSEKRTTVELKKSKLDAKPKPMFNLDRPAFDLSKPVDLSVANILSRITPPTPTKQKPEPEKKTRTNFGFSGRSLFSVGKPSTENKSTGKPQKSLKQPEMPSTSHLSSKAALNHTAKIDEINEKMRYVRQLEKEFNESKIKRQRDEEEEKEKTKEQTVSKRKLSFGKSVLHSLVGGRRS